MGVDQKYVMVHADDAGLSHAENQATIECLEKGIVNSYSVMVTCSGFEEIAEFAKANPKYDYGIHLTLTCEWHYSRFGPVSPIQNVQSLVDHNGHFHKTRDALGTKGRPNEVYTELKAQIEKALDFGLLPSHLDSHMYSIGASSEFFEIYKKLGREYNLPLLINPSLLEMAGISAEDHITSDDLVIEHAHFATFDAFENGHLQTFYRDVLNTITPGLHIILIHPALDTDEMQQMTLNHPNFGSRWRQMDYETFTNDETVQQLEANQIKLINWKQIDRQFRL